MKQFNLAIGKMLSVTAFLLLASVTLFAQSNVTGKVVNNDGSGIQGVTVTVKGTNIRTQTDVNGNYTISAPKPTSVLVFSSVGFVTFEVPAASASTVLLKTRTSQLEDIVVIGYGTARKKDLTGSVAVVNSKDFQKGAISTPEQLLAGKVAGVSIISSGGAPGSGSQIRIRGGASLSASNSPLIVVDGLPLSGDGIAGSPNPLSLINPNDIETFTILKDASAAAIYGTRAANGVIIITTKKGSGGKLKVDFSTLASIATVRKTVDVLSADQVRDIVKQSGNAARIAQLGTANTDWQNEIYQSAFGIDNNLALSGGIKNLPYRLSLGYQNLDGILRTDNYQRTSLGLNLSPSLLNNNLKINLNFKATAQEVRYADQGAIGAAVSYDPTQPVRSGNNRYGGYFQWTDPATSTGLLLNSGINPVSLLEQRVNKWKPLRSIGNIQFDYKLPFLTGLKANLNLGYDVSKSTGNIVVNDSAAFAKSLNGSGSRQQGKQTSNNQVLEAYLNYVKDITSIKSRVDLTAGYSYNFYNTTGYNYRTYFYNGDTIPNTTAPLNARGSGEHSLISVFSRLNYSLRDKYLLTATIRRDASSRFSKQNRWGTFPSLAFAWKIKQEDFLKNNSSISNLSLRLGYGVTGQQDGIGNYNFLPVYYSQNNPTYLFGNKPLPLIYSPGGYNGDLKWENTTTYNAGLDFGFAKNRINGSIDVYSKKTTDLLNYVPQPTGTNFALYVTSNVGDMTNKGVEFNLNLIPVQQKNFTWNVNFNFTYNKNEITNLTINPNDKTYLGIPGAKPIAANLEGMISSVGGPKNVFFLFKQVYDITGKPIEGVFEDLNRDGIINQDDRYRTKAADPNIFTGFSTSFLYKNFSLGVVMRGNFNNYLFNDNQASRGRRIDVLGPYTTGNANASYLNYPVSGEINKEYQPLSDYYLQNASFVKMDNLSLGYDFGKVLNKKANLRVNAIVQNVFTITKYDGLDPESTYGLDQNLYPRPRTYSLGFNLGF